MTIQEAYIKFLNKINKDNTSDNIHVDKGRFVLIFNEEQNRWSTERYNRKDRDSLLDIQILLVDNQEIINGNPNPKGYTTFPLPADYASYVVSYSIASKGNCTGKVVRNWITNHFDLNDKLRDANTRPSFEYEETLVTVGGEELQVYTDNFTVDKLVFTYYRHPKQVDIAGYIKVDGTSSTNIDPELADEYVDQIISRCAKEVMRVFENQEGLVNSNDRIKTEE